MPGEELSSPEVIGHFSGKVEYNGMRTHDLLRFAEESMSVTDIDDIYLELQARNEIEKGYNPAVLGAFRAVRKIRITAMTDNEGVNIHKIRTDFSNIIDKLFDEGSQTE